MAGNVQNVSFASPTNLVAPDLAVQAQQIQRQQQLAQALREQSLQDIPANGGSISWSQGLGKLLNAYVGGKLQAKADAAQGGLGAQYADRLRGMFGIGGAPAQAAATAGGASPADPSAAPPASDPSLLEPDGSDDGAPITSGPTAAPAPALAAGVRAAAGMPPPSLASGASTASPGGSPAPVGAPAAGAPPSPSPQGSPMGPLSLSGNAQSDMMQYALDPDDYMKALIAKGAPTDAVKNLIAQGLQPGTPAFNDALGAINRKAGFIDPTNLREGGTALFNDGSGRMISAPHVPEGYQAVRDAQGNVLGIAPLAGGPAAVQGNAAAKAVGGAAGDLVQRFNPQTNQMEWAPKASLLPGGQGAQGAGPGAGGALDHMFGGAAGGGNAAAPALGAPQIADTAGVNSANQFNGLMSGASGSQDRQFGLQKIADLAKDLPTGEGAVAISDMKSGVNSTLGAMGVGPLFSNDQVSRVQEIQKLASSLAQQQSAALGGPKGATDARLAAAFASLPDAHKAPQAIADITSYLGGQERAIQGKAAAGANWQARYGSGSFPQFASQWQKAYDPRIFQWMQQGPAAVRAGLAKLPPAERQSLIAKSNALAQMGALGQ